MEHWYVAETHARSELKALHHLSRQGFEAYLPRILKRRRHARRVDWVPAPLFPRYLFLKMDLEQAFWRPVNSTLGVTRLISQGNWPTAVPAGIVEEIRAREDESGMITLTDPDTLAKGDPVQIRLGAFCDQVGLFDHAAGENRVIVLLQLLGRQVKVCLAPDAIEALA